MFKGIKVNKNTIIALYKVSGIIYNISYINNDITTNICPSGSIKSAGGEYRSGILNWIKFNQFLDNPVNSHIKEIYNEIQAYLKTTLVERKWEFTIEYPNFVGKLDIPIDYLKIFSISWFNFYCDLALNPQSQSNIEFEKIMKMYKKQDLSFFKSIVNKFKQDITTFRYICTNIADSYTIGQKITILYELELDNMHDIKYDIWKEIAINEKLSKLVIDKVTNGFPLVGPHFLIKTNQVINLFDNKDQYKKIQQSEIATVVRDLLEKAVCALNTTKPKHKHKQNINKFINFTASDDRLYAQDYTQEDEFWLLRNNINYNKNHSENFIVSNTAMNMISEHAGRTIYDICSDVNGVELFADSQFANFNKYMFELCYNLYCLNTKVHCIHRDLHLNNIIISTVNEHKLDNDAKILFTVGDQKFIFDNNFQNLCLIDFNSAIINPEPFLSKSDTSILDTSISSDTSILDIQINNLLYYLYSIKPEYEEYDQFLKGNATYEFDTYFKILSVLDIYNICSKFLSFLKLNKKRLKKINISKSQSLIESIFKLADHYITVIFDEMINAKDTEKFQKMEWPILSIINTIFAKNVYKSGYESSIKDIIGE